MNYDNERYFDVKTAKPSYAEFFCSIDILKWIGSETINNINFTAKERTSGDVVTGTILDAVKCTFTGNRYIKPFIKAGDEGIRYRVKMQVSTVEESKEEFYMDFSVKNG